MSAPDVKRPSKRARHGVTPENDEEDLSEDSGHGASTDEDSGHGGSTDEDVEYGTSSSEDVPESDSDVSIDSEAEAAAQAEDDAQREEARWIKRALRAAEAGSDDSVEALPPPETDEEQERLDEIREAARLCDLEGVKRLWCPGFDLDGFSLADIDATQSTEDQRYEMLLWLMKRDIVNPNDSFKLSDERFIVMCQANHIDPTEGYCGQGHDGVTDRIDTSNDFTMEVDVQDVHRHLDFYLRTAMRDERYADPLDYFIGLYRLARRRKYSRTCALFEKWGVRKVDDLLPGDYPIPWKDILPEMSDLQEPESESADARAPAPEAQGPVSKIITKPYSRVVGNGYTVNSVGCTVIGDHHTVNGPFCDVQGNHCMVNGNNCTVRGADNIINGKDCEVVFIDKPGSASASTSPGEHEEEVPEKLDYPVFRNKTLVEVDSRTVFIRGDATKIQRQRDGSTLVEDATVPRNTHLVPAKGIGTLARFASTAAAKRFWREHGRDGIDQKVIKASEFDKEGDDDKSEALLCIVCCVNQRAITLQPCGHLMTCATCLMHLKDKTDSVLRCTYCKTVVKDVTWARF